MVASYGSYLSAFSGAFFFYVLYVTFTEGEKVEANYWADRFEQEKK
jgi:heme/copper-type cytochrome/quinol oxidase subunit 1